MVSDELSKHVHVSRSGVRKVIEEKRKHLLNSTKKTENN